MVIKIIKMIPAELVFVNSDNLRGVKNRFTFAADMVNDTSNLSTDFVQDMLAESPAKEPKAVMTDRIPKLPKNVHWAVKGIKTIFVY